MKHFSMRLIILLVIAVALLITAGGGAVLAQGADEVMITNPSDGETVSGIVPVVGTINFPNFLKYEIFYKIGDRMIWGATVHGPVIEGILARLDTRTVADGTYQLIIRTVHPDSNYEDVPGPTIIVDNGLEVPRPFPEVHPSPLYPPQGNFALIRVENCSGFNLEFDYTSPEGFCSSGNLWIMYRDAADPLCTSVDVLVIAPCEYRGTVWDSGGGENPASTYMLQVQPGKIYEFLHPGGGRFFINEIPGDDPTPDAADLQPAMSKKAAPPPTAEQALPVSGQATVASRMPFAAVAFGLISFLVVGGVLAIRRGKQVVE
jgi:hypothetical protein